MIKALCDHTGTVHGHRRTLSTDLLAAALLPLVVEPCGRSVVREGGPPISSQRLPGPHPGAPLALVRQLPLDDADLLPQSFGSPLLTDAVLPGAHLVQTRLHVMQLLVQREPPAVLWQEQLYRGTRQRRGQEGRTDTGRSPQDLQLRSELVTAAFLQQLQTKDHVPPSTPQN